MFKTYFPEIFNLNSLFRDLPHPVWSVIGFIPHLYTWNNSWMSEVMYTQRTGGVMNIEENLNTRNDV
jgi:hypothetical protein